MRLGLSDMTCPQRLREKNPVKVIFVLYDSKPNHSPSYKSPIFLLVNDSRRMTSEDGGLLRGQSKYHPHIGKWTGSQTFKIASLNMQSSLSLSKYTAKKAGVLDKAFSWNKTNLKYLNRTLLMACLKFAWSSKLLFLWTPLSKENSRKNTLSYKDMRMVLIYSEMDGMGSWPLGV